MSDVVIDTKTQGMGMGGVPVLPIDRLRTIVQDSHLNFLVGAGTPSSFFGLLGDVENALTELAQSDAPQQEVDLVRTSIQGYFFERVIAPNIKLIDQDEAALPLIQSYERFLRTLNRILLKRRSTLLGKQVNLFTTNVDMAFEIALESLGIDTVDGFNGKIKPKFDLGEFGTVRFRQAGRYEHRSEVPVVNLYKIHGSAGWRLARPLEERSDIIFDHRLALVRAINERYQAAAKDLLPITSPKEVRAPDLLERARGKTPSGVAERFAKAYQRLAIVNPEKTKFATTVLNETYYELIRRFANELEKENSVLFVHGFSFRDEHLRDLVLRACRANPTLQVIVFCYSLADEDAYRKLMPELDVKNGNLAFVSLTAETVDGDGREQSESLLTLDRLEELFFAPLVPEAPRKPDHVLRVEVTREQVENPDV